MARPELRSRSKFQASFARAVGERLHAAVVEVAAAIEHNRLDPGLLRGLGEQLPDLRGLVGLRALERLLESEMARGGEGPPLDIVHELGLDAPIRAKDDEARTLGGADDVPPDPAVSASPRFSRRKNRHHALFPTFRR